jgi:hypothetical protein
MTISPFLQRHGVGYKKGSTLAIVLGIAFECAFWVKLVRGDRAKRSSER